MGTAAGAERDTVDLDCADFPSQAAAQAVLDTDPGDPHRLDGDNDGYACESRFGEPDSSTSESTTTTTPPETTTADKDCADFPSQAAAQAALEADRGDPHRLDADKDGVACESRFGDPASKQQVKVHPTGGVATGGGAPGDGSPAPVLGALVLVGAGALLVLRRRAHRQPLTR